MPIYEYKCLNCSNQLEVMQKISENALTECPRCQGRLEKQWSLSGFQFKGSGWYVSDYANRTGGEAPEGKAESNSDVKSEAKPATPAGDGTASDGKTGEKGGAHGESKAESTKTPANGESTASNSGASQSASQASENKSLAKTD